MLRVALLASAIVLLQLLQVTAGDIQSPLRDGRQLTQQPHRVAIIGAGPGGSSASYHLRKFSHSSLDGKEVPLDITVFESNSYIGGRATTVNALDDPRYPVELGASIFVEINHILYNATRDFGLSSTVKLYESASESKYELGIWDGEHFVYKAAKDDDDQKRPSWQGWWDIAKLIWRYGLAPIRTRQATRAAVGEFLKFYEEPIFPFWTIQEAVDATGLEQYTGVSGKEVLQKAKVGDSFSRDIIQASTRVNYASNLGGIHGLETLVCMAIEGAMAVEGGNWQIFDNMVYSSADAVFLNTSVTTVTRSDFVRYNLTTDNEEVNARLASHPRGNEFDAFILAAPFQFANINFTTPLRNPPEKIPYVDLHVTLFTSPHRLSAPFFGLEDPADVPSSVLTTLSAEMSEKLGDRRGADAVGPPGFWSISTLDVLNPATDGVFCGPTENCTTNSAEDEDDTQYLYKIFSPAPLTGSFLSSLLGFTYTPPTAAFKDPVSSIPKSDITWLHEKVWHSYPYELPRTKFEPFNLCSFFLCAVVGGPSENMWYLNGMESFISTMETAALSGMNVARSVVDLFSMQQ
jgi:prenylcysteine oxidase/farnesylcysteine lyase